MFGTARPPVSVVWYGTCRAICSWFVDSRNSPLCGISAFLFSRAMIFWRISVVSNLFLAGICTQNVASYIRNGRVAGSIEPLPHSINILFGLLVFRQESSEDQRIMRGPGDTSIDNRLHGLVISCLSKQEGTLSRFVEEHFSRVGHRNSPGQLTTVLDRFT